MTSKLLNSLMLATALCGVCAPAFAEDVTLTIESWRNDDLAIWQDKLIPAFEAKNPGIKPVPLAISSPVAHSTHRWRSTTRAISPRSKTLKA